MQAGSQQQVPCCLLPAWPTACLARAGYINTVAYLVAPGLVPPELGARAGGLMALSFQAACMVALLTAYALQLILLPEAAD